MAEAKTKTKKTVKATAPVFDLAGKEAGKADLPEALFGQEVRPTFLHEVTVIYENNLRSGDAHTKTRSEVNGGGKKPWKQKGTGRARHGSTRSPIWRKGGVAFGPRTRDWTVDLPKKKARLALVQALSSRAASGSIRVLEELKLDGGKTKEVAALLKALKVEKKALIVIEAKDENLARASKNIQDLKVVLAGHLNAYDILASREIIMTKGALEKLAPRAV